MSTFDTSGLDNTNPIGDAGLTTVHADTATHTHMNAPSPNSLSPSLTERLAQLAELGIDDLPSEVVQRTKSLFMDWFGCALAGRGAEPVAILERYSRAMGPADGACELLTARCRSSAWFAALVNGAASHVVEQDDLHGPSVVHPATVVFPAALAIAQQTRATGADFLAGAVVGYEVGARVGEYLGPEHYRVFHTTATAGTLAAAAAAARVMGLSPAQFTHALGSAGTRACGLWAFLRDGAHSKQLHTGAGAADGVLAASLARDGFTGARCILESDQGMAAGMSRHPAPERITEGLGQRWAVMETSIKIHASCRHTHPCADAMLALCQQHRLRAADITAITARVYQAAIDVLAPVVNPANTHQAKFSMGFVLALIVERGHAGLDDFSDASLNDSTLRGLADKVTMVLDPTIDAAYPRRWSGAVEVTTRDGRVLEASVPVTRGDPEAMPSDEEIEAKARYLAGWRGGASAQEMDSIIARIRSVEHAPDMLDFLPDEGATRLFA